MPEATPGLFSMSWVWQFDGQWCMTTRHERRDAARFPSSGSVALPLKAIDVADRPWRAGCRGQDRRDGRLVGRRSTLMTCVVVPVAADVFVTVSRTVTGPGWVYCQVGAAAVESSSAPSPSRSHAYVRARFPGSVEVVPSKCHGQRGCPAGRHRDDPRGRGLGCDRADPADRPAVEVRVEQVAVRADHEIDRAGGARRRRSGALPGPAVRWNPSAMNQMQLRL